MPLASLPGPPSGQWHLGPIAVHGYALCMVLGVMAAVWMAERRYQAVGGRRWLILDLATVAVPAGLIGARLYQLVTDYQRYFGHDRDWIDILRIWDGGLGLPGAAAAGFAATVIWCRRSSTGIGPVLNAAVPGLALGQAIGVLGNWFSQSMYGPPSGLPWAVEIAPRSRVPGYQDFGTFQPLFLYESVWDVLIAVALIRIVRARSLTGGQTLAVFAALYAIGRLVIVSFLLTTPQQSGALAEQLAAAAVIVAAAGYLYATRADRSPEPLTAPAPLRVGPGEITPTNNPVSEVSVNGPTVGAPTVGGLLPAGSPVSARAVGRSGPAGFAVSASAGIESRVGRPTAGVGGSAVGAPAVSGSGVGAPAVSGSGVGALAVSGSGVGAPAVSEPAPGSAASTDDGQPKTSSNGPAST